MGVMVVSGAVLMCTEGTAPAQLNVTSQSVVLAGGKPAATIKDTGAFVNITPCGLCKSLINPQVAAATAAALGVLQPQPCIPAAVGLWQPTQQTCLAGGSPCLKNDSQIFCQNGGVISIRNPGQTKVMI